MRPQRTMQVGTTNIYVFFLIMTSKNDISMLKGVWSNFLRMGYFIQMMRHNANETWFPVSHHICFSSKWGNIFIIHYFHNFHYSLKFTYFHCPYIHIHGRNQILLNTQCLRFPLNRKIFKWITIFIFALKTTIIALKWWKIWNNELFGDLAFSNGLKNQTRVADGNPEIQVSLA